MTIPTGVAVYPKEIVPPVRKWMEAGNFPNIQHWAEFDKGGHFAAFEQPETFINDLRSFFRAVRCPAREAAGPTRVGTAPVGCPGTSRLRFLPNNIGLLVRLFSLRRQ